MNDKLLGSLLLAALLGAGCATASGGAGGPVEVARPRAAGEEVELSPRAQRRFSDAVRAYEDGLKLKVVDWDALARKFQAAVDEDERHAEAHYNLGVIAERRGRPDEAAAHYKRAIEQKPTLKQAYENLAVLMENAGDRGGAEEQYKRILRAYPGDAGARARLAQLYLDAGDTEQALQLGREALLRDPKNVTGHKVVARVHLARGELPLAHLVALRASKLDGEDPELVLLLGEILEKQGKAEAATAKFRQAAQQRPDFLPARVRVAEAAARHGDWAAAAEHYEAILRQRPDDAAARLNLAIALRGLGKYDEALAAYEKAGDDRAAYGMAVILHRHKDQPEKALELYRRYVSGSGMNLSADHPVFADLHECEALVEMRLQEKALAERQAEEARQAKADAAASEAELAPPAEDEPREEERPAAAASRKRAAKREAKRGADVEPAPARLEAKADSDEPDDEF